MHTQILIPSKFTYTNMQITFSKISMYDEQERIMKNATNIVVFLILHTEPECLEL